MTGRLADPVGALDRLQTIFDGASVGIVHIDEVGHALHSNAYAQSLLGYTGEELLAMTFPDVIHPDHLEQQLALHAELVAGRRTAYELEVVAEGVETGPIWDRLTALGCTVAQGYVLSRPLPAAELTPWLERRRHAA
jgi:PAS domain-containing protein